MDEAAEPRKVISLPFHMRYGLSVLAAEGHVNQSDGMDFDPIRKFGGGGEDQSETQTQNKNNINQDDDTAESTLPIVTTPTVTGIVDCAGTATNALCDLVVRRLQTCFTNAQACDVPDLLPTGMWREPALLEDVTTEEYVPVGDGSHRLFVQVATLVLLVIGAGTLITFIYWDATHIKYD